MDVAEFDKFADEYLAAHTQNLKISGEALKEKGSSDSVSPQIVQKVAASIAEVRKMGIEVAVVVAWVVATRRHRWPVRPSGGDVVIGGVTSFLDTLGIGNYAPSMVLLGLLGMHPIAAYPIMIGSQMTDMRWLVSIDTTHQPAPANAIHGRFLLCVISARASAA